MIRKLLILLFLAALPLPAVTLDDEVEASLHIVAVAGREEPGASPVDTFVSSDSPLESHRFAFAPLGKGPVLRGMDNGYLAPREVIDRYRALAERSGIPVQVGFTGGATDGMAFLANGPVMLPFSWPGRNSHSPVEVADLRDVDDLVRLVVAVATDQTGVGVGLVPTRAGASPAPTSVRGEVP